MFRWELILQRCVIGAIKHDLLPTLTWIIIQNQKAQVMWLFCNMSQVTSIYNNFKLSKLILQIFHVVRQGEETTNNETENEAVNETQNEVIDQTETREQPILNNGRTGVVSSLYLIL